MKTLSVIIPCYNEASTISLLLDRISVVILPKNWNMEIIIVDDGSKDETRKIIEKNKNDFKIISHPQNKGKGTAVKTGLENALGDYILIQDADLEYNPSEIPSLIEALEKGSGNAIYGSRNIHHVKRKGMIIPRLGVWFITRQFNFLYKTELTDLWTCYKLFPRSAAHLFINGKFESELIFSARLIKNGYKISEVPISHKPRTAKEGKKIRYKDGIIGILTLLKEYFI